MQHFIIPTHQGRTTNCINCAKNFNLSLKLKNKMKKLTDGCELMGCYQLIQIRPIVLFCRHASNQNSPEHGAINTRYFPIKYTPFKICFCTRNCCKLLNWVCFWPQILGLAIFHQLDPLLIWICGQEIVEKLKFVAQ